jgi:hypothetical protein
VGPPSAGCGPVSPFLNCAAMQLTTLEVATQNSQIWKKPRVVRGLTTISGAEGDRTSCNSVTPCITHSSVFVKGPSTDITLVILAGGASRAGRLISPTRSSTPSLVRIVKIRITDCPRRALGATQLSSTLTLICVSGAQIARWNPRILGMVTDRSAHIVDLHSPKLDKSA